MPEAGGPTTQSGILYQNSIAALFLGRLCDAAARPDRERVIRVRVEAPTQVDDTVVTFADTHNLYIQAKENIRIGDEAWKKLWNDFSIQFRHPNFRRGQDRLALYIGTVYNEHHVLRELCERASGKDDHAEWWNSLNEMQRGQATRLRAVVEDALIDDGHISAFTSDDDIRAFFASIDIVIWPRDHIERDLVPSWMPPSSHASRALFRLLRDRIGGEARIRHAFTAPTLRNALHEDGVELHTPVDINDLYTAVRACGALLRQHKHTIADTERHLRRSVVNAIMGWLHEPSDEKCVSLLLDQAGMGKTVVMRDILCELEDDGVTVLAIKADQQLSGIGNYTDLATKLHLPEPVERMVQRLAVLGQVVILIDQIDALSLSLARDQTALNIVLDLVARLRLIPGVWVLISCRTFDYRTDPQLKRIDARTPFQLTPLSDDEIKDVLQSANIRSDNLPMSTLQLLRTPLHLDLYVQVFAGYPGQSHIMLGPVALTSLQDLYHLLWNEIILKVDPNGPPDAERVQVIHVITDYMDREQQTSAPQGLFLTPEHSYLLPSARWLASAGILLATATEWNLLHQTFFDYCYARQFVEAGRDLVQTVLAKQGLRTRPQMIQVLAYLRGRYPRQYLQSLSQLLNAENLRYHLSDLLTRWFGALSLPTPDELTIAQRLLVNSARRPLLLAAMASNPDWLMRLSGAPLQSLLALDDESLDQHIIPYLASLINIAQEDVVTILKPYLGQSDAWNRRVSWVLLRIRHWNIVEAVDLLENALPLVSKDYTDFLYEFHGITRVFPQHGFRLLCAVFDQVLDQYAIERQAALQQQEAQEGSYLAILGFQRELDHLNSHFIIEILVATSKAEPDYFIEMLFPWLIRVLALGSRWPNDQPDFSSDEFDTGWYDTIYPVGMTFIRSLIDALAQLAQTEPKVFRRYADHLGMLPYNTPQRLLASVYCLVPEAYADEALQFLLADQRRLSLGEIGNRYDTRKLIKAIYPYLKDAQRAAFEAVIQSWIFDWRPRDLYDLRRRGYHQLMLLNAVPQDLLTESGQRYLHELERKFPDFNISEDPRTMHGGMIGPPIDSDITRHMSNRDWLRAMQHYSGTVRHRDFLKGGASELSGVLQGLIKEQPERFYLLLTKIPDTVDDVYVGAYISGLTESHAPSEWLFTVLRRFSPQPHRHIHLAIYQALVRRSDASLPDDIRILLEQGVRAAPDQYEQGTQRTGKALYTAYLNSERGTAFRALMRFFAHQTDDADAISQRWKLIELAATDPSTVLRAGAIEELLYLMHLDRSRAITLFEQLLNGHETLVCSHYADDFIYHSLNQQFDQIIPYIRLMMGAESDECRQRGAELACIAAISPRALKTETNLMLARGLAEKTLTGDVVWRRGAARIYAFNIIDGPREQCAVALKTLLNDQDAQVCQYIGTLFHRLRPEHLQELRSFMGDFAKSRSFQYQSHFFAEYLWEHSTLFPDLTLSLIDIALQNEYPEESNAGHRSGEEFVRSVLRIYTDPTVDELTQQRAIDIFDHLMKRFPSQSQHVLDEWDRR